MLILLKLLQSLVKTLHSEGTPLQIAAGVALGAALGLTPLFNVVLLDDDDHTDDYVIEMLCQLFLKSKGDACRNAEEDYTDGSTVKVDEGDLP